ncbi:hypothetical protein APHAL10511_003084 [Amanita phalloides]|nr:hypothetical protein APHAL10511_003084 [Amanita phalloides]
MVSSLRTILTAGFVEGILFGIYFATLVLCLIWLLYDEGWKLMKKSLINWTMLTFTVFIFILLTSHLGISYCMAITALAHENTEKLNIVSDTIVNVAILITDANLIYRCWVAHAYSLLIISPPIVLWAANITFSVLHICWTVICVMGPNESWTFSRLHKIELAFNACSIAITIYATFAIIYRIVRVTGQSGNVSRHTLTVTCRILAESGTLYTVAKVLSLLAAAITADPFLLKSVFNVLTIVAAGIVFNFIQIRVRMHRARRCVGSFKTRGMDGEIDRSTDLERGDGGDNKSCGDSGDNKSCGSLDTP